MSGKPAQADVLNKRFASKFNKEGPYPNQDDFRVDERTYSTRCWPWIAATNETGYGYFWLGDRLTNAHRYMYYQLQGRMENPEMEIDHLCRNRICINLNHLEEVNPEENQRRGMSNNSKGFSGGMCKNGHVLDKLMGPARDIRKCGICLRWNARIARARKRDSKLNHQELNYLKKENEYVGN